MARRSRQRASEPQLQAALLLLTRLTSVTSLIRLTRLAAWPTVGTAVCAALLCSARPLLKRDQSKHAERLVDPIDLQHGAGGYGLQPALPDHHVHRAAGLGESSCCRQEPSRGYLRARTGPHRPGRPPAQRQQLWAPTTGDCAARPPPSRGTRLGLLLKTYAI